MDYHEVVHFVLSRAHSRRSQLWIPRRLPRTSKLTPNFLSLALSLGNALRPLGNSPRIGTHGVSGSLDQKVVMYNFRNNSKELVGEHEGKAVRCVAVSNSGTSILSGGWDKKVLAWDLRTPSKGSMGRSPVAKAEVDGKVFSMSLCQAGAGIDGTAAAAGGGGDGEWSRLIVGTSGRKVYVFDRRDLSKPVQVRDSPLKSQTRCITALPRGAGFVIGSTGGRVAVEYFLTPGETKPRKKFAFKTHRVKSADGKTEMVFPVNTVCYHPVHGTFATGGGDGIYNIWDGDQKKRLYQSTKYPTSISSLAFSQSGKMLAVASSYTFEQGEKDHPPDTIYIRELEDSKVMPKAKRKASA